jgi:hypothetical protein
VPTFNSKGAKTLQNFDSAVLLALSSFVLLAKSLIPAIVTKISQINSEQSQWKTVFKNISAHKLGAKVGLRIWRKK